VVSSSIFPFPRLISAVAV